jgi:hypothetical protein
MSKQTQDAIRRVSQEMCDLLIAKNEAYGDSALNPARIFSKSGPTEQILVRIDDKLSRLQNGHSYPGDNEVDDLIGYLILLKIANERHNEDNGSAKK